MKKIDYMELKRLHKFYRDAGILVGQDMDGKEAIEHLFARTEKIEKVVRMLAKEYTELRWTIQHPPRKKSKKITREHH